MAGNIGALVGALRGKPDKPSKRSAFPEFNCEISLSSSNLSPLVVDGVIFFETGENIYHFGIRVQLNATINLSYKTKVDNRVYSHHKMENLIGESKLKDDYYTHSRIRHQLLGFVDEDDIHKKRTIFRLEPGTHKYPFSLRITEPLPAPFRNQYGNLQYKVVVYMRSRQCYIQVTERPLLKFRGYYNLSEVLNAHEPLQIESGFQRSLFSSKKAITVRLEVEKVGFLPGEHIPIKLNILNPKSFAIRGATISLIRRISYNINGAIKITTSTLNSFEINEATADDKISWAANIAIAKSCPPSYNVKSIYTVADLLQYVVKVSEYPGPLKGQVEIIVGTTEQNLDVLISREMDSLRVGSYPSPSARRARSNSMTSSVSDSSLMTHLYSPPNYSQLPSRAGSGLSLETLPPHYDELQ